MRSRRLDAFDWLLLGLGLAGLGMGVASLVRDRTPVAPPTPLPAPAPVKPPPIPQSASVVVELDASPTGSPVTVTQGQVLTFRAPAGGTIDTISKMAVNAASYSGIVQNVPGNETTAVVWHDANGSYTTTIPITIVATSASV